MSIKTLNALLLAGVLSLAASAALATEGPGGPGDDNGRTHASAAPVCDGTGPAQNNGSLFGRQCALLAGGRVTGSEFHANAAPACDTDRCPVLAAEGGPTGVGDHNGRDELSTETHRMFTADDGPVSAGDLNSRSAALIT